MQISRLGTEDTPEIGRVLARAMFDDPLANYMLPDSADRARLLPVHLATLARYCTMFGEVYGAGSPLGGCALWLPPGETDITPERAEAAGLDGLEKAIGADAFARFFGVVEHTEDAHNKAMGQDHWYLQVIGVDPAAQASGLGQALLSPILARADKDGYPCYLETFAHNTIGYYQKRGFETVAAQVDPVSGLSFWTMKRPPGT